MRNEIYYQPSIAKFNHFPNSFTDADHDLIMQNRLPQPFEGREHGSLILKFYHLPNGEKAVKLKVRVHGTTIEESFTQLEIEEMFERENSSQLIHFFRKPSGEKEILVRKKIRGEMVEERWSQLEVDEMFENM